MDNILETIQEFKDRGYTAEQIATITGYSVIAKFKYCPECGKKIKWQERTRMDISTHALEEENT